MPIFAAAIAGGASLAGGALGARADKKAAGKQNALDEQQRAAAFQFLEQVKNRDALFGGLENSALLSGQKAERGGFAGARAALDLGAKVARQGLIQRGAQNQANTEQSVVSQGLIGTSTGAQAFSGVGDQTSQQLAAIDSQLAGAFSDLNLQEGSLLGQQGRERTALAGRNRDIASNFGYEQANLVPRLGGINTRNLREQLFGQQFSAPSRGQWGAFTTNNS